MSNEQKQHLQRLIRYQALLKSRLESELPKKHLNRAQSFKNFLNKELILVTSKIEAIKLEVGSK